MSYRRILTPIVTENKRLNWVVYNIHIEDAIHRENFIWLPILSSYTLIIAQRRISDNFVCPKSTSCMELVMIVFEPADSAYLATIPERLLPKA